MGLNQFDPHVVVVGIKFATYGKTQSGQISPSAKEITEGVLQIEGTSLDDCNEKIKEFINRNGVIILNEQR